MPFITPLLLKKAEYIYKSFHSACICTAFICVSSFAQAKPRILVFTKTQGYDHATRICADSVIKNLGINNGFDVDASNSTTGIFNDAKLKTYKALCFINVTGEVFNDSEAAAFQRYMKAGGGLVGMHASTDCEYKWHWYGENLGAYFNGHPFGITTAKVTVLNKSHPSTSFIKEDTLTRSDEWYFWADNPKDFRNNPLIDPAGNKNITVLMSLLEPSIPGAGTAFTHSHPIAWYQEFEGGRVWYCGFGHKPEVYTDTLVKKMMLGGILWAAGLVPVKTINPNSLRPSVSHFICAGSEFTVYDLRGKVVLNAHMVKAYKRSYSYLWDGRDNFGRLISAGQYFISVRSGSTKEMHPIFLN
jgi:type 1 glutamine amidotransferase